VQFYNTPPCSARAHLNHSYGSDGSGLTDISFTAWAQWVTANSSNPAAKIFLGLPAAPAGADDDDSYLSPAEALEVAADFFSTPSFGGIMLWEATLSENNTIDGKSYAKNMKEGLFRLAGVTSGCPRTRILGTQHVFGRGNLLLFTIVISCSMAGLLL
jgi:chitinase